MRIIKGKEMCDAVPNVKFQNEYSIFLVYAELVQVHFDLGYNSEQN